MPRRDNASRGKAGEEGAVRHLEEKGYQILARNFRSRDGEVDIIAQTGETLVFAEVKAWSTLGIEALEQGINEKKQRRIVETAKYFLLLHRKYRYMSVRFDVIFAAPQGITHLESAFTESV